MEARVQKCEVYIWQCQYLCNQWFGLVRASKWCKAQRKLQMLHSCNKSLILSWAQYSAFAFNTKHSLHLHTQVFHWFVFKIIEEMSLFSKSCLMPQSTCNIFWHFVYFLTFEMTTSRWYNRLLFGSVFIWHS